MKLKLDDKGNAVLQDGNPVYIHDDGSEHPFDAKASHVALATAKREAGEFRTKLKEATDKLAAFSGIEDPEAALKAMQFAASMDGKKVMDDEGIQKLIQAAVKPLQEKLNAAETTVKEKDGHIYKLEVSNRFQSSAFVKDKLLTPPDMLEAAFGKHFSIEGGKVIAKDASGNPIYSKINAGEPAGFDEAIQALVDAHPMKDNLYKASGASGAGSQGGSGAGTANKYEGMSPTERITAARAAGQKT